MIQDYRREKELEVFKDWQNLELAYESRLTIQNWRDKFEKQLKYKKPFLINSDVVRDMQGYQ